MTSIIIYLAISMLFGIISCFFGRKLYFPIMMLTVFIAVVSISFSLFDFTAEVVAITCIVGIIAALLAKFIYKLGVFLMGCLLGASFGNYLPLLLPQLNEEYYNYIVIIVALIIGFFALKWCDVLIMASTAYNGARIMAAPLLFIVTEFNRLESYVLAGSGNSSALYLGQYLNGDFSTQNANTLMILTIIIGVIGFICQFKADKKR